LLQIFSETVIGPVFFEFIQRKEDDGFGEGNFTALFQSMERDQLRRGALVASEPMTSESVASKPVTREPVSSDPVTSDPVA
jgi:hypothetical protein